MHLEEEKCAARTQQSEHPILKACGYNPHCTVNLKVNNSDIKISQLKKSHQLTPHIRFPIAFQ